MSNLVNIPHPRNLYVAQFGERVKVGIAADATRRQAQLCGAARSAGLVFEPLMVRPLHVEAEANERAVVDRFGDGSRREFLDADAGDVLRFVQTLPFTPMSMGRWRALMAPVHDARLAGLKAAFMRGGRS